MTNMSGFIVGLLMIFFISGQTEAQGLSDAIAIIQQVYEWGMKIYGTVDKYQNPDRTRQNVIDILNSVNEISTQLDTMENNLDIKLDAMLNTLLADIKLEPTLNSLKAKLRHSFSKIDVYFDKALRYKIGGSFTDETLKNFANKALWSAGSVPDLLDEMYEVFFPKSLEPSGYLSVLLDRTRVNILLDCNMKVSTQQHIFYVYIQTFMSAVKGLIVRIQSVLIQRHFDGSTNSYSSELNEARTYFENHARQYTSLFTGIVSNFPKHIRQCDANPPVLGTNYIELQNFFRLQILDPEFVKNSASIWCPFERDLQKLGTETNTKIDKCRKIGNVMTACPAVPNSHHKYLWLQNEYGKQYGPNTACRNEVTTIKAGFQGPPKWSMSLSGHTEKRPICACETTLNGDQHDETSIWRISVTPQYSDFFNNKVVTGVKFVTQDNAIHLQIQQAAFSQSGMGYESGSWKDLDIGFYDAGIQHTKAPMQYQNLDYDHRTLYLDDVKAPDDFVVTGVKLDAVDSSAFMLSIFVCPFDFNLGEVHPFGCKWINGNLNPMEQSDLGTERTEIDVRNADSPTRTSEFRYDLKSHKKVSFTYGDLYKDGGQTTVPLLDAQPVVTSPPFPLSGIGLSFRGRKDYAGYIAPRIFTYDFVNYLRFPHINSVHN